MKILAIGRPRAGLPIREAIARHASDELRALWALYRDGFVREMYSPGGPGAVLILEAASMAEAQQRLAGLPLVDHVIIEFELVELQPFTALEQRFARP
jgi:hypothetical protein